MDIFDFREKLANELLTNWDYMVDWITNYANGFDTKHWAKSRILTAHLTFNRWYLITEIEALISKLEKDVIEINTEKEKAWLYFYTKVFQKRVEVWVEVEY